MLTVLNRLRGTKAYYAKVTGVVLGLLAYFITTNGWLGFSIAVGYVLGESFGWGKWIGGIIKGNTQATMEQLHEDEGVNNGIHWIANKLFPQVENYQYYCNTALGLRGFYWGFLTMLPLFVFGYLGFFEFHILALLVGVMFPLSVHIGKWTTTKFNYNNEWFGMRSAWEHAEVWYGLGQDLVLLYILF